MIVDPIATHGRARAAALAMVDLDSGRRWTWAELDRAVNVAAGWLFCELGAASGARVATLARNAAEMVILQQACIRAGAIFAPFNWRLAPTEIALLIADAAPMIVFHDDEFAVPEGVARALPLGGLTELRGTAPCPACARRGFDEPSTLLYTSGTSGRPKGVMISAANAFWGGTNFMLGNNVSAGSVFLCDMPLFHTAGLFAAAGTPLLAGATLLISRGFDPALTLARIADLALGVTHYFSVPQMAQMLWNQPGFDPAMLRGLLVYATGGAPNPAAQIERFVNAGVPMSDGFGMSETCSNFGMPVATREQLIAKAGSCGLPYIATESRIVDDHGGDVASGETGELWLRGPSVTRGYWNQPELTAAAFSDGWFRTGDAARRDADGFYFLVDRQKDMFISGGENVYPAEVEAAIAELAAVAECAVIGLPDAQWGEVGCAFVIAAPEHAVTAEQVLTHCAARLARFKVPKSVIVGTEIPRTSSGKVQKHLLKARAGRE